MATMSNQTISHWVKKYYSFLLSLDNHGSQSDDKIDENHY